MVVGNLLVGGLVVVTIRRDGRPGGLPFFPLIERDWHTVSDSCA